MATPTPKRKKKNAAGEMPPPPPPPPEPEPAVCLDPDAEMVVHEDGSIDLGPLRIGPRPRPALTMDNEQDRPRLMISHIENYNFKSYAGKQTLGPFHKSFTSIVGPNGSGKSNVIDAMLFVFGYRAQQIRSKKISVLIHDSEKFSNLNSCTVRVHFQEIIDRGGDGQSDEVVAGSHFSVARTAFKDNTSYYELDKRRVPFKEVAQLLRKKGIDLDHNRFLILQGEVEQIALMKPKGLTPSDTGMLEFLEDIIGSSRYQEPIELLKKSVAELDDVRAEKLNRVKLVEKEKDELEGPKDEALGFLKMENELIEKKNLGYQKYIHDCRAAVAEVEAKKKEYEEGVTEVLRKVTLLTEKKTEKEQEHKASSKKLDGLRQQLEEARENLKAHELEDAKCREEMKNINSKRKKLMYLSKQEREKLERLEAVPETNRAKIDECVELKDKLTQQLDEEQVNYDKAAVELKSETQQFQDQKEQLETKLIDLRKELDAKESDLKVVQSQLDLIRSKEEKEKCKLDTLTLNLEQAKQKFESASEKLKGMEGKGPEMQREIEQLEKDLGKINGEQDKKQERVRQLLGNYEEKRANMNASKSKGKVHGALMEQKANGALPGIFGRLGDLGAIDAKYDVAISTATGSGLDTILVDNVDTAKRCIEFLRHHNVGRANFLALDKTLSWAGKAQAGGHFPENAPRLFDLVKMSDPRFATAFYHTLRDTLVATNMEQAQRIAFTKQRFRVVTLTGEVIETSGAMSGGGRTVIKGKMGSQVTASPSGADGQAAVQRLERELREAENELQELMREKVDKEDRLRHLKKQIYSVTNDREKLTAEVSTQKQKQAGLKEQIKSQQQLLAKVKPDQAELDELEGKRDELQAIYDEVKGRVEELQAKIKKLNQKIKEVMGSRLKAITKKMDEMKGQLDKVKAEITRLEVGIKSADRDVKKCNDKLTSYEAEITEAENKMKGLKTNRDELEVKGRGVIDKVKEINQKEEEETELEGRLSEEIEQLKVKETKYKSQQIEINQVRQGYEDTIEDKNKKMAHWRREVKKLRLKEIPGEDLGELETFEPAALDSVDMKQWQYDLNLMEEKLASQTANYAVIEEFRKKEALYVQRVTELDEMSKRRDKQRKHHDDLRKRRLNEFMEGFSIITAKLKEMYQMITLGGDAELELVDSLDPFTEGIVFSVRPPKKSWKNISNLSGGEKTLSSLALVFALHFYKPTPLYVMDEIDAALDFKNVSIVANYIRERTKNAQFVIISLRSNMFELADRLVGIYKTYNCTKSVAINPAELAA